MDGNSGMDIEIPEDSNDRVYIAVTNKFKENETNLIWCLREFTGFKIIILHIHELEELIPGAMGGKMHHSKMNPSEVKAYRQLEWEQMIKAVDQCVRYCAMARREVDKLIFKAHKTEIGVVDAIVQENIHKLVMGAGADHKYSRKMKLSRKALHVYNQAHPACQIWFICKGILICTRHGGTTSTPTTPQYGSPLHERSLSRNDSKPSKMKWFPHSRSRRTDHTSENQSLHHSSSGRSQFSDAFSRNSSQNSLMSSGSFSEHLGSLLTIEDAKEESTEFVRLNKDENSSTQVGKLNEASAENHSVSSKSSEERLLMEKQELEMKLTARDNTIASMSTERSGHEVCISELSSRIAYLEETVRGLSREKAALETKLADSYQILHETRTMLVEAQSLVDPVHSTRSVSPSFAEFPLEELKESTRDFDPTFKLGEGGFGAVYRGNLRYTMVAIKKLNPGSTQGTAEFQQEIDVLTKIRHPNLVALIGACSVAQCIVYEFLPNGSLEDRLMCKNGTQPLWWQVRCRIAAEICRGLLFLHSATPQIVHGDLKPANILLDANLAAKISDFGICRLLPTEGNLTSTICKYTDPKGSFAYIDPHFLQTGELTLKADVYAFGVILLQLLTGKSGLGLLKEVQVAVSAKKLQAILDPEAGNWPFSDASQLANLGLQCCELNRKCRPDLAADIWRFLQRYL